MNQRPVIASLTENKRARGDSIPGKAEYVPGDDVAMNL
jgi:hypothetical protein